MAKQIVHYSIHDACMELFEQQQQQSSTDDDDDAVSSIPCNLLHFIKFFSFY
ncbi:hypothetical protein BLA29_012746 [Euroglyphus maynei]|uniref:Uncharacterized protein n=1 Tax=Euroglyphus maynei TaxID=6958 RepID=A0A1Y3BMD6_EURMA|nr:hypothetical protein BLA29_012746 [Euroglyphus maynei]